MPRFGFVGPSYASQSLNVDAQMCNNWYPEIDESGAGNAPISFYPTPGTKVFVHLLQSAQGVPAEAGTVAGPCAPNEQAWANAGNVLLNTPGTYTTTHVNE